MDRLEVSEKTRIDMIGAYITVGKSRKKWFFTGDNFDTQKNKMEWFESSAALDDDMEGVVGGIEGEYRTYYLHSTHGEKIKNAMDGYRKFTGHEPVAMDEIEIPAVDVGFKFGKCDGVLYTAVRDGIEERYIHEFSEEAKPDIVSAHDGRVVMLVGGAYRFTSRGIVDDK